MRETELKVKLEQSKAMNFCQHEKKALNSFWYNYLQNRQTNGKISYTSIVLFPFIQVSAKKTLTMNDFDISERVKCSGITQ